MYNTNIKFYESIANIVEIYAIDFPQFNEIPENNITYYKCYSNMINMLLEQWILYYNYLFSFENLCIVDNGSTNTETLNILKNIKQKG